MFVKDDSTLLRSKIEPSVHDALQAFSTSKQKSNSDVLYFSGDKNPWRKQSTLEPIVDPIVISTEEDLKMSVEDDDAKQPGKDAHADMLCGCGIQVEFLLALTYSLDLWDWFTWEVASYLVKPATETKGRCRFAHLEEIKPFTGRATVFISHCWGGKWGDLVAAACAGARRDRFVWIDVFAVRQWPGNSADLDFSGKVVSMKAVMSCGCQLSDVAFKV
jgi:hypothetical protein